MSGAGPAVPPPRLHDYPAQPRPQAQSGGRRAGEVAGAAAPAVSIVTIVRNGAATLPRALASVLTQDLPEIEYVIVDGGSTDGTLDVLRATEGRIALWSSEPDRGISDAFNKGIALSRGAIIGMLNCDDWYEPGALRAVVEHMQQTGADIACGALQYRDGERRTYLASSSPELLERGMTIGHPTVFVRRECYERLGLFRLDFRLAMDYEWLLRAKAAGARFVVVDRCIANMQAGGVGDRRWRDSQREVARARAMHVPGADGPFAYHAFVARRIAMGSIRRLLDAAGLDGVRRAYHRWFSPVTVVSSRDDGKH
jgi:glycosyltransferase involved in cell wall biosynthesis